MMRNSGTICTKTGSATSLACSAGIAPRSIYSILTCVTSACGHCHRGDVADKNCFQSLARPQPHVFSIGHLNFPMSQSSVAILGLWLRWPHAWPLPSPARHSIRHLRTGIVEPSAHIRHYITALGLQASARHPQHC